MWAVGLLKRQSKHKANKIIWRKGSVKIVSRLYVDAYDASMRGRRLALISSAILLAVLVFCQAKTQ